MIRMRFGQKLEMLLARSKIRPIDLAAMLEIDPSGVSRWIAGTQKITLERAMIVAKKLGVTLDYLMDDEQDEPVDRLPPDEVNVLNVYRLIKAGQLPELGDFLRDLAPRDGYKNDPVYSRPAPPTPPGEVPAEKRTAS
jgi:transcriptional regulator with XRE-family HTH domain